MGWGRSVWFGMVCLDVNAGGGRNVLKWTMGKSLGNGDSPEDYVEVGEVGRCGGGGGGGGMAWLLLLREKDLLVLLLR